MIEVVRALQFFNSVGSIVESSETGGAAYMAHIDGFLDGFVLAICSARTIRSGWLITLDGE